MRAASGRSTALVVASSVLSASPAVAWGRTSEGESEAAPSGSAEASVDASGATASVTGKGLSKRKDKRWINRWAPEWQMVEFGPYIGAIFPAQDAELFEPDFNLPNQGFKQLSTVGLNVGGRFGYFPLPYFGLEVEGGYGLVEDSDDIQVDLWMVRGHGIAQLGLWSITPFILVGGGVLAVSSPRYAVGDDIDQAFHLGLGAKFYINRYVQARFDFRDIISPARGINGGATNTLELLFGLSVTLGREKDRDAPPREEPKPAPSDRDDDGFFDDVDQCPDEAGIEPDGCPPPPDSDADGFPDETDQCPQEPGIEPDGCPDPDPDKDGILGDEDACPQEPETRNGFEDEDGCPDEVPEEVQAFQGTLEGIFFALGKATLRPQSRKKLDETVDVLKKYPDVKVEISGHSDSTGPRELNMDLSRERAESVKNYLVEQGIEAERIQTRGAGPDEPIDTNATPEGRAKNRRIEFRLLES